MQGKSYILKRRTIFVLLKMDTVLYQYHGKILLFIYGEENGGEGGHKQNVLDMSQSLDIAKQWFCFQNLCMGVPQNSLHISLCNFSAYDALRFSILDIFNSPFHRLFKIVQEFKRLSNIGPSYKGNTDRGTKQNPTKFMFN